MITLILQSQRWLLMPPLRVFLGTARLVRSIRSTIVRETRREDAYDGCAYRAALYLMSKNIPVCNSSPFVKIFCMMKPFFFSYFFQKLFLEIRILPFMLWRHYQKKLTIHSQPCVQKLKIGTVSSPYWSYGPTRSIWGLYGPDHPANDDLWSRIQTVTPQDLAKRWESRKNKPCRFGKAVPKINQTSGFFFLAVHPDTQITLSARFAA